MTQNEIDRAVAKATGESRQTIAALGFSLSTPESQREPLVVDWDELDEERVTLFTALRELRDGDVIDDYRARAWAAEPRDYARGRLLSANLDRVYKIRYSREGVH